MFDAMDFLMKDLVMQARLLKTAQTMQMPALNVTQQNAAQTLGPTSNYQPGALDMASQIGMFAGMIPGIGGRIGQLAYAASAPGSVSQGFDSLKQILPSASSLRKDLTLPDSF